MPDGNQNNYTLEPNIGFTSNKAVNLNFHCLEGYSKKLVWIGQE